MYSLSFFEKAKAESLAQKHCSGCHLFPKPETLEKETWGYVLGYMGLYLGIEDTTTLKHDAGFIVQWQNRRNLLKMLKEIPAKPAMKPEEWNLIRKYYIIFAAEKLHYNTPRQPELETEFQLTRLNLKINDPAITLLDHDQKNLYVGTAWEPRLMVWPIDLYNAPNEPQEVIRLPTPPVYLQQINKQLMVTLLGDLLGNRPLEFPASLGEIKNQKFVLIKDKLPRTAMALRYLQDWLIPGFGVGRQGNLQLLHEDGSNSILSEDEGFVSAHVMNLNDDEQPDILALVANSRESLRAYLAGAKTFQEIFLQRFDASCGFTRMKVADLNADGVPEVVLTAGDNPDAGPYNPPKPCHGVYVYTLHKKPSLSVKLAYFEPFHGALDTAIVDLNDDGRMDLVTSTFYPDISRAEPYCLLIMRQQNELQFSSTVISGQYRFSVLKELTQNGDANVLLSATQLPLVQKIEGENKTQNYKTSGLWLLQRR